MQKPASPLETFLSSVPIFALLVATLAYGTGEMMHAQLLGLGESLFPGYALLKQAPEKPTCDPAAFVIPEGDEVEAASGGDEDDLMADLEGAGPGQEKVSRASVIAAKAQCEESHAAFTAAQAKMTPAFRRYEAVEGVLAAAVGFGVSHLKHLLVLLIVLAAIGATAGRHHIAMRGQVTRLDARLSEVAQLLANGVLLASQIAQYRVDEASGVAGGPSLQPIWVAGAGAMMAFNVRNLLRLSPTLKAGGTWAQAMAAVPLYAVMVLVAGTYFIVVERYPSGLAVQIGLLAEHALLYLQVGLYVWIGMLLKRTRAPAMAFDVLRPFALPPELLSFIVVAGAALPTAYSGASGIFVMAAGSVVYAELRRAGATRQLSIAATAMSGSLGVVLRPCLLVVIVASLNKQVTTDELYRYGGYVYFLTAGLVLLMMLWLRPKDAPKWAMPEGAVLEARGALAELIPYFVVGAGVVAFYTFGLSTPVSEHSAPNILPVVMLLLLAWDMFARRRMGDAKARFVPTALEATGETSGHIGALLMLMGASVGVGGIVQRSGLMDALPASLGTPVTAMAVVLVVLVVVGMTMDPYGAVILVSATFATVAYNNGIHPAHFWMVVLCAFELGYLMPPISLNQLLTRQVVGEDEWALSREEGSTFFTRNLSTLAPLAVMALTLLLVAFVPFLAYSAQ